MKVSPGKTEAAGVHPRRPPWHPPRGLSGSRPGERAGAHPGAAAKAPFALGCGGCISHGPAFP